MTTKLVPIFKAGKHISASGQTLDASPEFCEELVASYNKDLHQAPFCYGHPKDNAPAGAWASSLVFKRETGTVYAETEVVDGDLVDNLESGRYRFPSASLYMPDSPTNPTPGKPYLRHVAVLGAQAPAIKGLGVVSLNEADQGVFTFAEEKPKSFWARLREFIAGEEAAADAPTTIPEAAVSAPTTPDTPEAVQTPATAPTASNAAAPADFAEHSARLAAKEAELAAREAALRTQEAANFCEGVIRDGRVRAADKEAIVGLFNALSTSAGTVDFAEGAEPVLDVFKKFLTNMPKLVEFSEVAPAQNLTPPTVSFKAPDGYTVNPAGIAQLAQIEQYAVEKGVDFATAVAQFNKKQ